MNDKEYQALKKRIRSCTNSWITLLGLSWWTITLEYHREEKPEGDGSGRNVSAQTPADWRYLTAKINFYMPTWAAMDDQDFEKCIVHELMHVILNEMREDGLDHEERVASVLANAFLWTKQGFMGKLGPNGNKAAKGLALIKAH